MHTTAPSDQPAVDVQHGPRSAFVRYRDAVDAELRSWCAQACREFVNLDPGLRSLADEVSELTLCGGKRLRAGMVLAGHQLVGAPVPRPALRCAAAVEMLHSFALLHDDVIDQSSTRRDRPTAQVRLGQRADGPSAAWFGVSGAILAGDLALAWSDAMLDGAGLDPVAWARVRALLSRLRTEAIAGEFLDARAALAGVGTSAPATEVLRTGLLKSGRYTVTRPLQLGVAIGSDPEKLPGLQRFGDRLGVAFQLRDDLLDLYGADLGKPIGVDAGHGSVNAVLVRTRELAAAHDRRRLADLLVAGGPMTEPAELADLVDRCGARAWAEEVIAGSLHEACRHLADLPADAPTRELFRELLGLAAYRSG